MAESRGFRNSTSSRVENELKTIKLRARKVKKKRVTIINLRMNKRSSNSFGSSVVKSMSDFAKVANQQETRFRDS